MKSLRIHTICSLLNRDLPVWDIGCDHGLVGRWALSTGKFPEVHFVDPVYRIIETLRSDVLPKPEGLVCEFWQCHAEDLPSERISGNIVIAGMGTFKITQILNAIIEQRSTEQFSKDYPALHRPTEGSASTGPASRAELASMSELVTKAKLTSKHPETLKFILGPQNGTDQLVDYLIRRKLPWSECQTVEVNEKGRVRKLFWFTMEKEPKSGETPDPSHTPQK